ncbi:MAG TPA: hypothetical protein VFY46_07445 [Acidimicrobiia bacterium]|nr:hypothetical protein [Acidimicrobiia bacterium]
MDLLERHDPAAHTTIDRAGLRAKVEDRITSAPGSVLETNRSRRPLLAAAASFALLAAGAVLVVVLTSNRSEAATQFLAFGVTNLADLPGVEQVVDLETGGVKSPAVDGDTIWLMEALHRKLNRIDSTSGSIEATYDIDGYVEGVVVGGGYVWLSNYEGEEVLRFDPALGEVDLSVELGGLPGWSTWFANNLWVSNQQGELLRISVEGEVLSRGRGEIKGQGLGYLWVNDPETGLIASVSPEGTPGEIVIPTHSGLATSDGFGVRGLTEVAGDLWLMDGMYPFGTNFSVFDPVTGELSSFGGVTFGLHSLVEFEEELWLTSHTDHLLIRIDPNTGSIRRYPMPGKAGGLEVVNGTLWVALHHPGALIAVDADRLIESADIVSDDWNRFPHRLLCTGASQPGSPTVILEPFDWIDYGVWSVVQAQISNAGYQVCANGYVGGEASPEQRAADLEEALEEAGIPGPYVLVAAGDGIHSARLFADGRKDIDAAVLVDPMAIGFQKFLDTALDDPNHPPWADLDPSISESLEDFGSAPLIVIGHDPEALFLSERFVGFWGEASAQAINDYWQQGLDFYAGLSTNSRRVTADETGLEMIIWDRPDLIAGAVLEMLEETR